MALANSDELHRTLAVQRGCDGSIKFDIYPLAGHSIKTNQVHWIKPLLVIAEG